MADLVAESLLEYRTQFPALEGCVHLISHSLGCVPAQAKADLAEFFDIWQTKSITAWSDWLPEVDRAAERIAKIISAPQGTVIMQHNVSQIMATMASCFEYTPERNKVVYEALQFPTVSYVWQAETEVARHRSKAARGACPVRAGARCSPRRRAASRETPSRRAAARLRR